MSNGLKLVTQESEVDAEPKSSREVIDKALATVREHFGMEVAYLSEFVGDKSVFRAVSAPGLEDMAHVGAELPLETVYCQHIVDGRLPSLMPDTDDEPFAQTIPITQQLPVRAHMSLPIRRDDGSVYGMFCCLSRTPNRSLNDRDLSVMEMFVDLATEEVRSTERAETVRRQKSDVIEDLMRKKTFHPVYQPICDLHTGVVRGYESLTRFLTEPKRTPDLWFAEAEAVGLGSQLELAAIAEALQALPEVSEDKYLSVNVSPETAMSPELREIINPKDAPRILLEITEHSHVADYDELTKCLEAMRWAGTRVAVDDAGAGYSSLQHIVKLRPDVIKLDMTLTRGIDTDKVLSSLASALIRFAGETNAVIVAEGVETASERDELLKLGIDYGQGWFLGKPQPASEQFQERPQLRAVG
ncbi:MAG: EAL domain-containing protein [Pseudomonadota bacterium]